ncbi:hypothetical protein K504DRAFT_497612, partial [Pleomassaria siparia CBS 279.74]
MRFTTATHALVLGLYASTPVFAEASDLNKDVASPHVGSRSNMAANWVKIPRGAEGILESRQGKGKGGGPPPPPGPPPPRVEQRQGKGKG